MSTNHAEFVKELRIKKGLSQEEVANKIGIGRNKYIKFEQGSSELKFSEMVRLTDFFGISLEEVENGINADYEKYKEMILGFLRNSGSIDGKIPKTKLAKLVYLADFAWFYEKLISMSGMQYRKIQFGPVPNEYFRALNDLEETGLINIDRKGDTILIYESRGSAKTSLNKLIPEETNMIKKISDKWKDKKTNEIVTFTHNQLPYKICSPDEIIPYELITQEDPADVY